MTDIRQVLHVGLTVRDLDRSVAFYRDQLGCEPIMRQEKKGGYLAAIVGYPDAHLCFLVPDLRTVHARLAAAGVDFVSGPVEVDTGANAGGLGLYLRDPDGITLELFQPRSAS